MALRFDPRGEGRHDHARDRQEVAVREGGVGLQGRGSGGGESVGPRPRPCAVRPAGDLAHLVARPSGRDPGRNDLRARDPARQALPLRRAHRGNADRAREGDRDHLELPGQADHGGRSHPRLRRPREMIDVCALTEFIIPVTVAAAVDAERVGPKAANLAALAHAGLPTPGGFCLSADAYRAQIATLGLEPMVRRFAAADVVEERRLAVEIRLALYEQPIAPSILAPLLTAWRHARKTSEGPSAVRSSALIEDRKGSNFAGQFESFLGIDDEAALLTAVRACWAALWTTNARRGMANHARSPADTAMAVLIQPLVDARASGGGLSETASGGMLISATWGLGSAIAQGEVVPDRIVLSRQGF